MHRKIAEKRQQIFGRLGKIALGVGSAFILAQAAWAEAPKTVTLKYDDGDGVTGEIISFSDGVFRLDSLFGVVSVPSDGVVCIGAACPDGTTATVLGPEIVLKAKDGSFVITGNLLEIADDKYFLATDIGEFRVNISDVTCTGDGCVETAETQLAFGGSVTLSGKGQSFEGNLVDLSEEAYIIELPNIGLVRINRASFVCSGEGCP